MRINFNCPTCNQLIQTSTIGIGFNCSCPKCNQKITVPNNPPIPQDTLSPTSFYYINPLAYIGNTVSFTPIPTIHGFKGISTIDILEDNYMSRFPKRPRNINDYYKFKGKLTKSANSINCDVEDP